MLFRSPETDRQTLIAFYRTARPFGPGWDDIRREAGPVTGADDDNIPRALLGWFAGCVTIWSGLFMIGQVLYGRLVEASILAAVFVAGSVTLAWVMAGLWPDAAVTRPRDAA